MLLPSSHLNFLRATGWILPGETDQPKFLQTNFLLDVNFYSLWPWQTESSPLLEVNIWKFIWNVTYTRVKSPYLCLDIYIGDSIVDRWNKYICQKYPHRAVDNNFDHIEELEEKIYLYLINLLWINVWLVELEYK